VEDHIGKWSFGLQKREYKAENGLAVVAIDIYPDLIIYKIHFGALLITRYHYDHFQMILPQSTVKFLKMRLLASRGQRPDSPL